MNPPEVIRQALQNAKGDDLERATMAFCNMSDEQLDEQYGQSGHTCREVLAGYQKGRAEWRAAWDLAKEKIGFE